MASKLGEYPAIFKFYEDGKHRRYNLLFSVNGGVLAMAKLLPAQSENFLAALTLRHVAVGMIIFTIVMGIDIWIFGTGMRREAGDTVADPTKGIFSSWGKGVLAAICALMTIAWLAVAFWTGAPQS